MPCTSPCRGGGRLSSGGGEFAAASNGECGGSVEGEAGGAPPLARSLGTDALCCCVALRCEAFLGEAMVAPKVPGIVWGTCRIHTTRASQRPTP